MDGQVLNDWFLRTVEQTRQTVMLTVPQEYLPTPWIAGTALILFGVLAGSFGASYSKVFLSIILGGVGFVVGESLGGHFEHNPLLFGALGFGIMMPIGYLAHRLWVGIAVGLLACSMSMVLYGHDTLWPEFLAYHNSAPAIPTNGPAFQVPTPQEQQAYRFPSFFGYLGDYYQHIKANMPKESRNAAVLACLTMIAGTALGSLWTRWALILSCSIIATILLNAGLASMAEQYAAPGWETNISQHPQWVLGYIVTCVLLSTLVQYRVSKPQKAPQNADEKPKS